MTLKELEDGLLEHFNYDLSMAESRPRLRIRRHLNLWHRRFLTMPMLARLREATVTFDSVANQAEYTFRHGIARILRIYERTNDQVLIPQSVDWYRSIEPDPQAGTATYWIPIGERPTDTDPSSTGLWVNSSSAADVTQVVHLQGIVGADQVIYDGETILNGVTRVQFGTETDFHAVSKFYLSGQCAGMVQLWSAAAAGTRLALISPGTLYSRYQRFILWPTPASVVTYYIDCELGIRDMNASSDEPMLPPDFHDLLDVGARIEEYEKSNDDTRASIARGTLARRLADLQAFVDIRPGYVGIPGEMMASRPSRLGPWFPAGT